MTALGLKSNPKLIASLERARNIQPTPEELYSQRLSFIYGSLGKGNTATIAEIDDQLKRQEGRKPQ